MALFKKRSKKDEDETLDLDEKEKKSTLLEEDEYGLDDNDDIDDDLDDDLDDDDYDDGREVEEKEYSDEGRFVRKTKGQLRKEASEARKKKRKKAASKRIAEMRPIDKYTDKFKKLIFVWMALGLAITGLYHLSFEDDFPPMIDSLMFSDFENK